MSKEVDNGVKKFFIIFLGFIVVLNLLSVVFFGHSLFYYFSNAVEIDYSWIEGDFSRNYSNNNILKHSMSGKCFIPIVLFCFFLFLIFTIKRVKKYRRYIYPFMYIVFLFILEFIVLCFFKECLSYMKTVHFIDTFYGVIAYIPIFHPLDFWSFIIYGVLVMIGNIFDNRNAGRKNSWYKIIIEMMVVFVLSVIISIIIGVITNSVMDSLLASVI